MSKHRDQADLIDSRAQGREKALLVGTVSKVWEKSSDDSSEGNIEVNVQTAGLNHELRRVPVVNFDHPGHIAVPQIGDSVIVDFTLGVGMQPVVVGTTATDKTRTPNARAGHWRHEFRREAGQNLYLEAVPGDAGAAGDPDVIRMGLKPAAFDPPTTAVEIDDSGSETTVSITTDGTANISVDGDVTVEGTGTVSINSSGGSPASVAPADHTHEYEDTGDTESGGAGATTKTSSEPVESGTNTQIG